MKYDFKNFIRNFEGRIHKLIKKEFGFLFHKNHHEVYLTDKFDETEQLVDTNLLDFHIENFWQYLTKNNKLN